MEYRILGKTERRVSVLGFGCGGVGGLMISNDYSSMTHTIGRAIDAGVNYFDTAQLYGGGISEENLGRVLKELKPDVVVGTKVRLLAEEIDDIEKNILRAIETSLKRLQRERLDLFQLHNPLSLKANHEKHWIGINDLQAITQAFQKLQAAGKISHWGINGVGETDVLHQCVVTSGADTIQICYNLINPSACYQMPAKFPFQDYQELMKRAAERQIGVIAFRVLAGGALAGGSERHPLAAKLVEPIASSSKYAADVSLATRFRYLISEGWVESIGEAAIRFVLSRREISTLPIGFSSLEHLNQALDIVEKGPLPEEALNRLIDIWQEF